MISSLRANVPIKPLVATGGKAAFGEHCPCSIRTPLFSTVLIFALCLRLHSTEQAIGTGSDYGRYPEEVMVVSTGYVMKISEVLFMVWIMTTGPQDASNDDLAAPDAPGLSL
jgi:hypothetical protein